jgi:hypothetical protein
MITVIVSYIADKIHPDRRTGASQFLAKCQEKRPLAPRSGERDRERGSRKMLPLPGPPQSVEEREKSNACKS